MPARVGGDAGDRADRDERGEAADGAGQRAEHAKLGAGVAIVGVEGVADEAAVAGAAAEQRDLALELLRGGGEQGDAEAVAVSLTSRRVAKLSVPSRIRSWPASSASALAGVMRSAIGRDRDVGVAVGDEGGGEGGLGLPDIGGAIERLALEVGQVDPVAVDDRQAADPGAGERGDGAGADPARADDGDAAPP